MQIAVIGAGAAGCFAAIELKRRLPDAEITVYEAQNRALAKVAITGGGRCPLLRLKALKPYIRAEQDS